MIANANHWQGCKVLLEQAAKEGRLLDGVVMAETRIKGKIRRHQAVEWALARGYRLEGLEGVSTGPGPLQCSAGVAVGLR